MPHENIIDEENVFSNIKKKYLQSELSDQICCEKTRNEIASDRSNMIEFDRKKT